MARHKESFATSDAGSIHHTSGIRTALICLKIYLINPNPDWLLFVPFHGCQVGIPCLPACQIEAGAEI